MANKRPKSVGKQAADAPTELGKLLAQAKTHFDRQDNQAFLSTCENLVRQFPDVAQGHHLCGVAYSRIHLLEAAEQSFRQAISLNPDDIPSAENLGVILDQNGWKRESYVQLFEVLKKMGKLGRAGFIALIRNALLIGDKRTAHDAVQFVISQSPNDPAFIHQEAMVAFAHNDIEGGRHILEAGRARYPDDPAFVVDGGIYALSSGNLDVAAKSFRKAIFLNPHHSGAHFVLADMGGGITKDHDDDRNDRLIKICAGIQNPEVAYLDQAELGFAAGKILDSQAHYDEAFKYYDDANRKVWARLPNSMTDAGQIFEDTKRVFDDEFFAKITPPTPEAGSGMVYLVGMPRSGTTLLEQMLSRLPNVVAGGETAELERILGQLPEQLKRPGSYPHILTDASSEEFAQLATKYMAQFRKEFKVGSWRTTKDMGLYMHLGLISVLFPAAKIIHCQRDPLDTCVSAYFQFFKLYHLQYTFDLSALAKHYRSYLDLMEFWKDHLPTDVLQFNYEDLTTDPETAIKRVAEFCGMEWSDDCLNFNQSDSLIKTASIWQVRQGLHQNSVARWRRYEKHIGPLIDEIGDLTEL
jgi:tetratricopeptide (TPR) repeat protein